MRAIALNNTRRLRNRFSQLLLIFVLTGVAIGVALYMSNQPTVLGRFAVVGQPSLLETSGGPFKFISVAEEPSQAELMMGKYDGYITNSLSQDWQVVAPKKPELAEQLSDFLDAKQETRQLDREANSQVMSNVIGFLMMFLLLGGSTFLSLVGEDREQHQLKRLLVSPLSLSKYLTSQLLYGFCALYVPTIGLFGVLQLVLKQELGGSLVTYSWLLGLICLLGVSFATMMMCLMPTSDTAQMIASALVILTTIISGSFGNVGSQQGWFSRISQVLPQKSLLRLVEQLERGHSPQITGYLVHIVACSSVFLIVAIISLKRQTKQ